MPKKKSYRKRKRFFRKGLKGSYAVEKRNGREVIVMRKIAGRGVGGEPAYEHILSPSEKTKIVEAALRSPARKKEMLERGEIYY